MMQQMACQRPENKTFLTQYTWVLFMGSTKLIYDNLFQ